MQRHRSLKRLSQGRLCIWRILGLKGECARLSTSCLTLSSDYIERSVFIIFFSLRTFFHVKGQFKELKDKKG